MENKDAIDFKALVNAVISSMQKDECVKSFIECDESARVDIVMAYAEAQTRKITQFTQTYSTNKEARELFNMLVLKNITGR